MHRRLMRQRPGGSNYNERIKFDPLVDMPQDTHCRVATPIEPVVWNKDEKISKKDIVQVLSFVPLIASGIAVIARMDPCTPCGSWKEVSLLFGGVILSCTLSVVTGRAFDSTEIQQKIDELKARHNPARLK